MRFLVTLPLLVTLSVPTAPVAPADPGQSARRPELLHALGVLHDWDAQRARAWAEVDGATLRSLYVAGSRAARADMRLLRAYADRGLVVRRLVTQVFAVRVLHQGQGSLRLRVVDRVAGGEMTRAGREVGLPSSRPVARTIVFRLVEDRWRVVSVSGSGRAPRAARR